MDRVKPLVTILIALTILGFFFWATLSKDDFSKKISDTLIKEKSKADILFNEATLAEIYDGIKYWELVAKIAVINKSAGLAKLSAVDGLFFDSGKPTIKFLAPSATWHINKNEIHLISPIGYDIKSEKLIKEELAKVKDVSRLFSVFHLPGLRARTYEGYWFQAKNLNWKLSTKKLLCSGAISLTKGNAVICAQRLEADVGLEKVLLTGNPTAEIVSDGERISISAKEFLIDSRSDIITADRNVIVMRGSATITSNKSIYNQREDKAELIGDVHISDRQIAAYAKTAEYDIKNSKVVLLDKVKAKRGENEIYGDRMTIYLGKNKILVEGRTKAKVKETEIK